MRRWQFHIEFIPRAWHKRAGGDLSPLFDEEGYDTLPAWRDHQPASSLNDLFSPIFPAAPVSSGDCLFWGNHQHTDAHVCREREMVASVGMHLDVRGCGARLLNIVAELASGLGCVLLVTDERRVIEPNVFALSKALRTSRAARYVQDPHHILDDGPEDGPDDSPGAA